MTSIGVQPFGHLETTQAPCDQDAERASGRGRQRRRAALIAAAVRAWSERGYAHVTVRNIARRTDFSHGMVHYYFASKNDLVDECVRTVADSLAIDTTACATAQSCTELSRALAQTLTESLRSRPAEQRIRYDLRNQSLFEPDLQERSALLDAATQRLVADAGAAYRRFGVPTATIEGLYPRLDGVLARAVLASSTEGPKAYDRLRRDLVAVLPG